MSPLQGRNRSLFPGGSLIEVIVSIGLLAVIASTLFVFLGSQLVGSGGNLNSLAAVSLAQEGLEAARAIRDSGWENLSVGAHGISLTNNSWTFSSASDTTGGFTRTVTVSDLSTTEKQVLSNVTWRTSLGQMRTTTLATNVSNWRSVVAPRLSGNWANPQSLGSVDLGPGNQATGVKAANGIVYMSGTAASAAKHDFYIINVTDLTAPVISSSINTGPGLNGLAVTGTFAYVANSDTTNQLQVINISSSSTPYTVSSFNLTGNTHQAYGIAVTSTLVLIGTDMDSGAELFLVNVSNPVAPVIQSSLEIGGDVNRIVILGNNAYLATSSSSKEFMVVDISNPATPAILGSMDLAGTNEGLGVYVNYQDMRAYVVRASAAGTSPEINILNVSVPSAPVSLGTMEYGNDVGAVFAADNLMFVGTSNSNLEFQIYDVTSPTAMTYYSGFNFPQVANDIAFENNVVYAAVRSNDALRIITSQ